MHTLLESINGTKAAGCDCIPTKLIKGGASGWATPLCILINRSLDETVFPTAEKLAQISPVYKTGDHSLLENYRPISVLNVLSKVIERCVYWQLSDYLERNKLLSRSQYGFRQGRSTVHAITYLTDYIKQNADNGNCTGVLYMDLKKAFDTVQHAGLLHKLRSYGIKGKELDWFTDYLFDRRQYVEYDGCISDVKHVVNGVPQGSILGPLLFIVLVNDMPTVIKRCKILMYADDTVLFYADKDSAAIQDVLIKDADRVASWIRENNLALNLKKGKTEFVLYGSHQKLSRMAKCEITINNTEINEASSYCYLGVTLDNHLTLREHVNNIYRKCSTRINLFSCVRQNMGPFVANTIYTTMIRPIALYCYPVFLGISNTLNDKLESIQVRASRIITQPGNIHLHMDSLQTLRKRRSAVDVFKSLNHIRTQSNEIVFERLIHGKKHSWKWIICKTPKSLYSNW